jgi:hypothetical protein
MASFRDMGSDSYFRFNYDNDYFAATDRNYTQGYSFELALPALKKNPINVLFIKKGFQKTRYGIAWEHFGYTPKRYTSEDIQYGDRPYASVAIIKSFLIAIDTVRAQRISSSFSIGMIGPITFGEGMQVGIHEATGNKIPLGWHNQIQNDVAIQYELSYTKELLHFGRIFTAQGTASAQVGTIFTNVSIGSDLALGLFESPYRSSSKALRYQAQLFARPALTLVEYDATLQGGKFNRDSPYTISSSDIERLTAEVEFGVVLRSQKVYLEYVRNMISKEFASGEGAAWGGIKIGVEF